MAANDDLRRELSKALHYYPRGGRRAGRYVLVDTLPMVTDKVWRGIPLCRAMSPATLSTGVETEYLFDAWVWPVKMGEGEPGKELADAGGSALYRYVTKGADFGERTVRLLYALSNADGASLVHDEHAIMVHHDTHSYGVIDGRVFSRFCDGTQVNADHQKILTESKRLKVVTREFCYLWGEAYLRRENLIDPLVALWQSCSVVHWSKLAAKPIRQKIPKESDLNNWLGILECNPNDPLFDIYKILVPKWMTKGVYSRLFGLITARQFDPDEVTRQKLMNNLCDWFNEKITRGRV